MNKSIAAIIILIFSFTVCAFVLRYALDTVVMSAEYCRHKETVTAVLYSKTQIGQCCWHVAGSNRCSESWFNCPMPVGTEIPWERDNYSCDDLLKKYEKPKLIDFLF